ncbi:hypothetical protein D3C75_1342780 [compost metagenome]
MQVVGVVAVHRVPQARPQQYQYHQHAQGQACTNPGVFVHLLAPGADGRGQGDAVGMGGGHGNLEIDG